MNHVIDRKKGCLYGLAIGDALGAAVEFQEPGYFQPVTGYRGGGPHGLNPGEWTDDTSMALALADSIAHGWDLVDQLRRYADWYLYGKYSVNDRCFDVGSTTRKSLEYFLICRQIAKHKIGTDGNGSIMRLAPVAIKYYDDDDLNNLLGQSSVTTHSGQKCVQSCVYLGRFLASLIRGDSPERSLLDARASCNGQTKFLQVLEGDYSINGGGYVLDSLRSALWAFKTSRSFEEAVLKAVNLGNDADTTGAVCGQIAGAYWGYSGIPRHLIDGLARKDMIDAYLEPIL
jgi:ADP-ribosyl-[dinitrogen reductase] hydrolase